ncbi:MAG TPA: methyltransferase domain-containing protein, partial [Leptospiraceae bacterium]|nr:methyltransferase domain-containing protein [Leptospiraceae bacterium]
LLDAGAKVIALDADERFLNYIQKKAESNPRKTSLSLRKIPYTSAELKKEEVDILLSVNVYHHIENRVSYFSEIKKSLKKDGFICIIDFKEGKLPVHSPPESMRISKEQTIDELQKAGFKVSVEEKTLDYQYIYVAK